MTLPHQETTEYIRYRIAEGQDDAFVDAYDRAAVYLRGSPTACANSEHLKQFVAMGVHKGTTATLESPVTHLDQPEQQSG
jgi:hypothetical protein